MVYFCILKTMHRRENFGMFYIGMWNSTQCFSITPISRKKWTKDKISSPSIKNQTCYLLSVDNVTIRREVTLYGRSYIFLMSAKECNIIFLITLEYCCTIFLDYVMFKICILCRLPKSPNGSFHPEPHFNNLTVSLNSHLVMIIYLKLIL